MSRLKITAVALEPSLWGVLPKELLHLVFARLPVAGIGRLRVLSKEWKRNVDCKGSEFNQVFDATAHLNMFALLCSRYSQSLASGNIYDVQADKWHVYETDEVLEKLETWDGADGGLVCCVWEQRSWYNKPGLLFVMNPLTKQKTQLPPLLCMGAENSNTPVPVVRIVKLIVDRKTKEYKVFVVGSIANGGRGFFAQVYDSHIKEWTIVEATQGHIIGWDCLDTSRWDIVFGRSLCVYNCADGTLQQFNGTDIAPGLKVEPRCYVLLEDHLFVLHNEASRGPVDLLENGESMLPKYCISEFHLPEKTTTWVKLGVRRCGPGKFFLAKPIINLRLSGCNGFLLVYGHGSEHAWLYNLSSCEWRTLPAFGKPFNPRMMCTISWSAMA